MNHNLSVVPFRRAVLWLVLALGLASAERAAAADPVAGCAQGTDPAQIVADCSTLIDAGQLSASEAAAAFDNRGNAYLAKSDFGAAIRDFEVGERRTRKEIEAFWPLRSL